ncbi:MAG: spore coat associated protein CotJA [Oscillospiraceae bacterium]|nr:spore coat associated protein CotJA [Oscillospiraceae bacterium]
MNREHIELAQSYVPWQVMGETFTPEMGLKMGTIFPELTSPYSPGESLEVMKFLAERPDREKGCHKHG